MRDMKQCCIGLLVIHLCVDHIHIHIHTPITIRLSCKPLAESRGRASEWESDHMNKPVDVWWLSVGLNYILPWSLANTTKNSFLGVSCLKLINWTWFECAYTHAHTNERMQNPFTDSHRAMACVDFIRYRSESIGTFDMTQHSTVAIHFNAHEHPKNDRQREKQKKNKWSLSFGHYVSIWLCGTTVFFLLYFFFIV